MIVSATFGVFAVGGIADANASLAYQTCDFGTSLCKTDTVTGVNTTVGSFGTAGTYGNAFNLAGTMYATAGSSQLATVNLTTGLASIYANLPTFGYAIDFDSNGNLFFFATNSHLYKLNSTNGAVLQDIVTGLSAVMDFAFDSNNNLYAVNGGNTIFKINALTGATISSFATTPANLMGLMFDENDALWATPHNPGAAMYKLNPTNGTVLQTISSINGPHGGDIYTSSQVPEPDTIVLIGLALAGLGAMRRRKHG